MSAQTADDRTPPVPGTTADWRGYAAVAVLSAVAGGICVALATRAVPKAAAGIASGMMAKMMACMREAGCDPGAT